MRVLNLSAAATTAAPEKSLSLSLSERAQVHNNKVIGKKKRRKMITR